MADQQNPSDKLNWKLILAALILFLTIGGVGWFYEAGYQKEAADSARKYGSYTEQKVGQACRGLPQVEQVSCFADARIESELQKRDYQREQADLVAQRKSALWTTIMGLAAVVGMIVGVLGVYLIWATFRAADKTAQAAIASAAHAADAANEMREANVIARETRTAELRPHVYLTKCHITLSHLVGWEVLGDSAPIIFYFQNFGHTPARRVRLWARTFIGGYWSEDFPHDMTGATQIHMGDMPQGFIKERDGYTVLGLAEANRDILDATRSIFVEGVVRYSDWSGKDYFTRFRLASTGPDYQNQKFTVTPGGNKAT